jgi:beta-glucanase (GH16 family)
VTEGEYRMKRGGAKFLSVLLVVLVLLQWTIPVRGIAQGQNDLSGHWAETELKKWVEKGILKGYPDGTIRPNATITRAEFVALIDRICNYVEKSPNVFKDVEPQKWYADVISKVVAAEIIKGDDSGRFRPNDPISRQEAGVIFAKVFNLESANKNVLNKFSDSAEIAEWSEDALSAMVEKGYLIGRKNNRIAPNDYLTRAECVKIIDRIVGELINKAGTYTGKIKGNAVVNTKDVTLNKMSIEGDLYLTEGIGDGDVVLNNVNVKGRAIIKGGGENTITIKDSVIQGSLLIKKANGVIKVVVNGSTKIGGTVQLLSGSTLEEDNVTTKGFDKVVVLESVIPGQEVTLKGDFSEVEVKASNVKINIQNGTIALLKINEATKGVSVQLSKDAVINTLNAHKDVSVEGNGTIRSSNIEIKGVSSKTSKETSSQTGRISTGGNETGTLTAGETTSSQGTSTQTGGTTGGSGASSPSTGGTSSSGNVRTAPTTPTNLTVTVSAYNFVDLSWGVVEGATGYNLYRAESVNGQYVKINTSVITTPCYKDTTVAPNKTYYYKVSAINANGESALSNAVNVTTAAVPSVGEWKLVWNDEFNGTPGSGVDTSKWVYETGGSGFGNNELQYCTDRTENVYIEQDPNNPSNRFLVIKAIKENYGGKEYTSGRIKTEGKFDFTYGKVEIRAKLPYGGKGIGASFWMLGSNYNTAGWPNCGEIDVMEWNGNTPTKIYGTIHGPGYSGGDGIGTWHEYPGGFSNEFHTYAIEWEPNVIRWYFDGQLYQERRVEDLFGKTWVFDHDFFMILGLGVGGTWVGNPDGTTVFPQKYVIDYVRVYQREGNVYSNPSSRKLVQIKNVENGQFVCADKFNGDYLYANRSSAALWETFEQKDLGNGNIALIALSNYKYVSADNANNQLVASKETIGATETFKVVDNGDGTKSLLCLSNNKYVSVGSSYILEATASTVGNSEKFIIYSTPTTPRGLTAASVRNYSVTLSWTAVESAAGYNIYRSAKSGGPYSKVNTVAVTSTTYTDATLSPGNTYYYRITAVNALGESEMSEEIFVTTPTELTAPSAPTGLYMVSSTENSITISWTQVAGATGYNVYRAAERNGTYTKVNESPIENVSYTDTSLSTGAAYFYKVTAVNAAGESDMSDVLFATTSGYGVSGGRSYSYILAVSNSKFVRVDPSNAWNPLTASASDASTDAELFEIVFKADGNVGFASKALNNNLVCADSWSTPDYKLLPRSGYSADPGGWETFTLVPQGDGSIAIKANNGGRFVTVEPTTGILKATSATVGVNEKFIIVTPYAPGQPSVTIDEVLDNSVTFHWSVPSSSVVAGYNVYRATTSGGPYIKLNKALLTTTSYTDTSVTANTTYYYIVAAVNARGETKSPEVMVKTLSGPLPAIPTGLDITSCTQNSITLSWNAAAGAQSYNIYRSTSRFGTYVKINTEPITSTTYTDTNLTTTSYYYKVTAVNENGETKMSEPISLEMKLFGPNVYIFDPNDAPADVQAVCTSIFKQQEVAQFGNGRYALLFKPGTYSTDVKVGFYTEVLGLGRLPTDTTIHSLIVDAAWMPNNNATCNFWRGAANLTVATDTKWAVSQAVSLRRVKINGKLTLHDAGGWASGGFLADSYITGVVESGSQQQWFSRNTYWQAWDGQVWNMVFVGVNNPPPGTWPETKYTTVERTPVIREKPFIYIDKNGHYNVFVPAVRSDTVGISWNNDMGPGTSIPIEEFYIAHPDKDTADTINAALAQGKHLLLTPGIYNLDKPIEVNNPNTVVLGIGLATLRAVNDNILLKVADVDGVIIAGILFDAGEKTSPVLLMVGQENSSANHSNNPITLSDLYFRVGGAGVGRADVCVVVNSSNVIGDHFWVWRADHGDGVAWDLNTTKNGMIVNGNDVTMYALFVEHFHEYHVVWNGNGGRIYFYQCELPYDVPNQESWMSQNGTVKGYASYKVADTVTSHEAWGLGIYSYFRDAQVECNSAIEVPNNPGVKIHNACTVKLAGYGGIKHVVNNTGDPVNVAGQRSIVTEYCNNVDQPEILPSTGVYSSEQMVTITCSTAGATIRYTLDGTEPTETNGITYSGPFTVSFGTTVIKARAFKEGMNPSYVTTATITVTDSLSFGKPATASSTRSESGNTPDKAFDGDLKTRWESEQRDPQWIMVDLGQSYSITGVKIVWETAAAKEYKIQVSNDNINWTDVYTVTDGQPGHTLDISFPSVVGRYVRMYGISRATSWGYSIYEFEVYGNKVATPVITPASGTYVGPQIVTITCDTEGATIKYTLDGSNPTPSYGIIYEGPFTITTTTTIKAIAYKEGMYTSNMRTETIIITNNLALNKQATASTGNASLAFDGNMNTRWESEWNDPQWIAVDLGAVYNITGIKLVWETAAGKDYKIQVSLDGQTWTDVFERKGWTGGTDEITLDTPVLGRYVRMYGTARTTGYGYSLWEFEVYGNK